MTKKLSKEIANNIRWSESFWNSFERVIVYYDNGQIELTKILTSVFSTLYTHVEFRKVKPVDYKLLEFKTEYEKLKPRYEAIEQILRARKE